MHCDNALLAKPLLCMRLGLHTERYKLGSLKKLFSEKSGAFVTGFCDLPAERLRMYMDQKRATRVTIKDTLPVKMFGMGQKVSSHLA